MQDRSCLSVVDTFLGKLQRITYKQPKQMYGLEALHLLNKAIDNGINLRGGKDSLGFLFIYELLTGMFNPASPVFFFFNCFPVLVSSRLYIYLSP